MNEELARLARHVLPVAVTYVVGRGWVPAELQQPIIEAGVAVATVIVALLASKKAAVKRVR